MADEKHNGEQGEEGSPTDENIAPPPPKRSWAMIALAALLGLLLTAVAAGGYYHATADRALPKAVREAQREIQRTDEMLADAQAQITGLSRQIHALRLATIDRAQIVARAAAQQ